MKCDAVRFTRHAFERLFTRAITPDAVIRIIKEGEVIASYPDDVPFPSVLILAFGNGNPCGGGPEFGNGHMLCGQVFRPDPHLRSDDF